MQDAFKFSIKLRILIEIAIYFNGTRFGLLIQKEKENKNEEYN